VFSQKLDVFFLKGLRSMMFSLPPNVFRHLTVLDAHVHHRATVESVRRMLNGAGFEPLEVVTDTVRMRFADGSSLLRHYFIRLGFLPAWQSVVFPDVVERTFAVLEQKLNTVAAERGELALTIPMACVEAQKPGAV
jgi:arsenite methyltransferase